MDRMLFNNDATKLLSELQYLKQNHYQNHSRDTGSPAVTQVTQLVTQLVTKLTQCLMETFLVPVLDLTLVLRLQRNTTVAEEYYSWKEKSVIAFVLEKPLCQATSILFLSQGVPEILASSLAASLLGALTKEWRLIRNKKTIEALPSYFKNSKQTNTSKNADSNWRLVQCLCDGQL